MAASERLSVKFDAVGAKGLQNAINGIRIATLGLTQSQAAYGKAIAALAAPQKEAVAGMFAIQTATRNTGNAFSVLRSKMLLVSFGVLVVSQTFGRLIKAASDLEEMMSKASVVFGDNMSVVSQWADSLGNSIGRASSEIITMASSLQDTFVPLGFTRAAATELSTSMTKLAIDVASFNNQQDADVVKDFQSAIVGNHMTVRKYGIIITQARLKLEALNMGLIKGNQQLTAQQKVQARLSLITKGSADAIGDAERTAGSYQNQMKALNAEVLESAEFFGEWLIKILQADLALGIANTSLVDFAKFMVRKESISGYGAAIAAVGVNFAIMRIAAMKAAFSIKALSTALMTSTGGAIAFVAVFGTLLSVIFKAISRNSELETSVETTEEAMKKAAETAGLLAEGDEGYADSISKSLVALQKKLRTLEAVTEVEKYQASVTHELTQEEILLIQAIRDETVEQNKLKKVKSAIASLNKKDIKFQIQEQEKLQVQLGNYIDDLKERIILENAANVQMAKNAQETEEANRKLAATMLSVFDEKSLKSILGDETTRENLQLVLEAAGLLETIDLTNLDSNIIEQLKDELYNAENAAEQLIFKILGLQEKLMDKKPWRSFKEGFSSALTGISDEADMYGEILTSVALTSEKVANNAENAWSEFANTVGGAFVDAGISASQANISILKEQANMEIAALQQSKRFNRLSRRQQEAEMQEIKDAKNSEIRKEFSNQKALNKADATMNYAAGIMKISKQTGIMSAPWIAALTILWAKQLDLINSQKAPVMEYGGLIGGKSHSQGGTMIEAEKGEFVVRKSAVEAVGIEALNRINTGQGIGGINITFQGNVLSNDFIEDEAIPQIREAIRRGADIGIG